MRLFAAIGLCLIACACTASEVTEAYCHACGGRSYGEAECRAWAEEAGCEGWAFVPEVLGDCSKGCTFRDCGRGPSCGPRESPAAADAAEPGTEDDAATATPDPACDLADERGLFMECAACDDCVMFTFNGLARYACRCGPCPCGFECGSVALPAGGELGGVCVPP